MSNFLNFHRVIRIHMTQVQSCISGFKIHLELFYSNLIFLHPFFTENLVFCETEGKCAPLEASQLYSTSLSDLDTATNNLATLWPASFLVKFWFSIYSPCLINLSLLLNITSIKVSSYLSHFKVGRGLPCLEMQVSSRISPSLRVTVGRPVIVGASGGPRHKDIL